jgi:hypothetical protein
MLKSRTHGNSLVVLLAVAFTRCGVADVETAFDASTEPLNEFLAVAQRLEEGDALFVGGSREESLRQRLQGVPAGDGRIVEAHVLLGRELLRLGDPAAALSQMRQALARRGRARTK